MPRNRGKAPGGRTSCAQTNGSLARLNRRCIRRVVAALSKKTLPGVYRFRDGARVRRASRPALARSRREAFGARVNTFSKYTLCNREPRSAASGNPIIAYARRLSRAHPDDCANRVGSARSFQRCASNGELGASVKKLSLEIRSVIAAAFCAVSDDPKCRACDRSESAFVRAFPYESC